MAVTAPSVPNQKQKAADSSSASKNAVPLKRFTAAAKEHAEPVFDVSAQLSSSGGKQFPTESISAFGYLRSLIINVTATGGTGGSAVAAADAPWSVIGSIEIDDTNGQPFYGPVSGYDAYLIHKWLSPRPSDPVLDDNYSAVSVNGNFSFVLRLPIEITPRDGLGSLSNMDSSATYKVKLNMAASTLVYSTPPATTLPTVRFVCYAEEWTEPLSTDLNGVPVEQAPPALGVTQEFSTQDIGVNAGSGNPKLTRMGNVIRALLFVTRDPNTGARVDLKADPVTYSLDNKDLSTEPMWLTERYMNERYPDGYSRDTGVTLLDFAHDFDGQVGDELRDQWLQTTTGTRFELRGSNWQACTLHVITNDVLGYQGQA